MLSCTLRHNTTDSSENKQLLRVKYFNSNMGTIFLEEKLLFIVLLSL